MHRLWASGAVALLMLIGVSLPLEAATLEVEIEGVSKDQEQNIRSFLSVQPLQGKEISSRSRLRYLHGKAGGEIRKALQPFGFYRPEISSSLTETEQRWVARYEVTAGPLLPIGTLDIQLQGEAREDPAFTKLLSEATLRSGNPLVHSEYETLKRKLRSLAAERGYYRAELTRHRVEVDLVSYQANISLYFDSGPRYRFGPVIFTPGPLSNELLLRYVPFKQGDPVKSSALIDLQSALVDSDYFQRVEVRPLWEQAEGVEVPIEIATDPQKRTKYLAGFGYGTDTGARAKIGVTRRWVNRRGHQFNTQLLASQIRNNLTAEYSIPGLKPQQDRYAVRFSYSDEDSDTINAENYSLGISRQQQLNRWQQVLGLDWQQETFTFGDDTQTSQFLIPRLNLSTVSTKDRLNVRDGYRLSAQLLGGSAALLSDTDFAQLKLAGKAIHSFTPKLRLLGRADAGLTLVDDFDKLPATLRFFAGGDNSVRGYDFQTLGPQDDDGTVVGGSHLLVGSAELDYRIKEAWGVAAFVDSGNAFDDTDIRLRTGVGVGVRWFSPIGPVRLDIAVPLDDNGVRLHFSLGPDL